MNQLRQQAISTAAATHAANAAATQAATAAAQAASALSAAQTATTAMQTQMSTPTHRPMPPIFQQPPPSHLFAPPMFPPQNVPGDYNASPHHGYDRGVGNQPQSFMPNFSHPPPPMPQQQPPSGNGWRYPVQNINPQATASSLGSHHLGEQDDEDYSYYEDYEIDADQTGGNSYMTDLQNMTGGDRLFTSMQPLVIGCTTIPSLPFLGETANARTLTSLRPGFFSSPIQKSFEQKEKDSGNGR